MELVHYQHNSSYKIKKTKKSGVAVATRGVTSAAHGFLYLPVELGDESVLMGVDARPQQQVSLLEQAAQVVVGALAHMVRVDRWVVLAGGGA